MSSNRLDVKGHCNVRLVRELFVLQIDTPIVGIRPFDPAYRYRGLLIFDSGEFMISEPSHFIDKIKKK
jgi:hypothetical protein